MQKTVTTTPFIQPWCRQLAGDLLSSLAASGKIEEYNGPECLVEIEQAIQKAFDEGEVFANAKREL